MDSEFQDLVARLDRDGFAIIRDALRLPFIEELRALCVFTADDAKVARRGDSVYGIRDLLTQVPRLREFVSGSPFIECVQEILGSVARPIHGQFFDKLPGANWPVPWHQDVTIRVRERRDVPGFESRPVKDGTVHVVPPIVVSEQILALRIHLDDATANHGALRVLPGSHRQGRLDNAQLSVQCACIQPDVCEVRVGDVMLMRPLLIHASSPCDQPRHRRVIHVEYAAFDLPGGLEWVG